MSGCDLSFGDYFLSVHKSISHGVEISIKHSIPFMQEGFPDKLAREGYLNYVKALSILFDSHHKTEDEIAFPFFREALPDTHFDWLFEDHNLITGFLEELTPIINSLEMGEDVFGNLVLLNDELLKISDRW
jgi:hypothetical protein